MKKGLIFATAAFAVVALSSCTTISDTAYTTIPETMVVNMTVADIDVSPEQVTATTSWNWNPFRTIKSHKANAEAKALRESGADVLIEPKYEIEKRGIFRGGSVTVTGHPGKFINFRNMNEKDAEIISTLKGTMGVATPVIGTTAPSLVDKLRPKKEPKEPKPKKPAGEFDGPNSFVSLTIGGGNGYNNIMSLGVMYGHYINAWGWYAKATCDWGDDDGCKGTGFTLTGGALRRLPKNFSVFAGIGVGASASCETKFNLPVDLGVQWNYKKLNLSLILQPRFGEYSNFAAGVGVGFNF